MASKKKPTTLSKQEVKGRVDKAEMDLSLSELTLLPIREMLTYTRVTKLDLSCNKLADLPEELCQMRQLVKLDLSKNVLAFLPDNIGRLEKLRELDLFSNRLSSFPLSFGQLSQLNWLDVKNNMLDSQLASIAGTCVDQRECADCAHNVVAFMHTKAAQAERARQENLLRERRALAKQKELDEQVNAERRRQRQELKQRRREEREAEQREAAAVTTLQDDADGSEDEYTRSRSKSNGVHEGRERTSASCFRWLVVVLLFLSGVAIMAGSIWCAREQESCVQLKVAVMEKFEEVVQDVRQKLTQ